MGEPDDREERSEPEELIDESCDMLKREHDKAIDCIARRRLQKVKTYVVVAQQPRDELHIVVQVEATMTLEARTVGIDSWRLGQLLHAANTSKLAMRVLSIAEPWRSPRPPAVMVIAVRGLVRGLTEAARGVMLVEGRVKSRHNAGIDIATDENVEVKQMQEQGKERRSACSASLL